MILSNYLFLGLLLLLLLSFFTTSGFFPMSHLFPSGFQSIEASASVFTMNIQG